MTDRIRKSLTAKIFLICFVTIHLPLVASIVLIAHNNDAATRTHFVALLVATLVGTAIALGSTWYLLRPIAHTARAIEGYRRGGAFGRVASERTDEAGILANAVSELVHELDLSMKQLMRQATVDDLTGLGNRRWLMENVGSVLERARRDGTPITVIMMDLDHFKKINDEFGHQAGDRALIAAGTVIDEYLRPYDLAARLGGEEFAIVLPHCDLEEALGVAERLRSALCGLTVQPMPKGRVTASFGVYEADVRHEAFDAMLKGADERLYAAKQEGRNRIAAARSLVS